MRNQPEDFEEAIDPYNPKTPVTVDLAQWPEARGFARVYSRDPIRQARLVMALLGFRQSLDEWHNDTDTVEAINTVIRAFHRLYPEFMQEGVQMDSETEWGRGTYRMDDRLAYYVPPILEEG